MTVVSHDPGAVVSFTVGLAGLIGWIFRVPLVTSLHSDFIPIAPSTALILCTYSVLIASMARDRLAPFFNRGKVIVAGVLTGVSIFLTITSLAGLTSPWNTWVSP